MLLGPLPVFFTFWLTQISNIHVWKGHFSNVFSSCVATEYLSYLSKLSLGFRGWKQQWSSATGGAASLWGVTVKRHWSQLMGSLWKNQSFSHPVNGQFFEVHWQLHAQLGYFSWFIYRSLSHSWTCWSIGGRRSCRSAPSPSSAAGCGIRDGSAKHNRDLLLWSKQVKSLMSPCLHTVKDCRLLKLWIQILVLTIRKIGLLFEFYSQYCQDFPIIISTFRFGK